MIARIFERRLYSLILLTTLSSNCGGYKGFMQDHFGSSGGSDDAGKKSAVYSFSLLKEPKTFKSCEEMDSYFAEIKAAYDADSAVRNNMQTVEPVFEQAISSDTSAPSASEKSDVSAAPASSQEGKTNVQEAGVDEADMVKVSEKNIYIMVENKVKIVNRKTLKEVDELSIDGLIIQDIYFDDKKLVLIGSYSELKEITPASEQMALTSRMAFEGDDIFNYQEPETLVLIYQETSSGDKLEKISEYRYSGYLNTSRLAENHLYLVINDDLNIYYANDGYANKSESVSARLKNLDCEDVQVPMVNDYDLRLTKVISLSLLDEKADPNIIGVIGGGDHLYMTQDSLYLAKQGLQWIPGGDFGQQISEVENDIARAPMLYDEWIQKLSISRIKFELKTGKMALSSVGSINGYVKDQWSFKEYADFGGALVVATTRDVYENQNSDGMMWNPPTQTNDLFVLAEKGQELEVLAKIEDFGRTENIRSVRFVERTAYVVTFRQTDPLFAFDLTDLKAPKLLGELKIPGFSTYMHPVAPGMLVGLGYDANEMGRVNGIQVSLFDVSNPLNLQRLDVHVHGESGSSSEAAENHHAFFHDAQNKIMAFPLMTVEDGQLDFQGAVVYDIQETKLTEVARLDHKNLLPAACTDVEINWWNYNLSSINRIIKLDGRLLTISRHGIKAHALPDYSETIVTKFTNDFGSDCEMLKLPPKLSL